MTGQGRRREGGKAGGVTDSKRDGDSERGRERQTGGRRKGRK